MKIGIDANEANVPKRVGIGQYAYQVIKHLNQIQNSKVLPAQAGKIQNHSAKFKIYLKNVPQGDFPEENDWWQYCVFGPKHLWTQAALPLRLFFENKKPDVFFSPSHYAPRFCPCPRVIAIMDLSFVHFGEMFTARDLYQLKAWTAYSVKKVAKILTISNFSKKEIVDYYKVSEENIVVTHPGYDTEKFKIQSPKSKIKKEKIEKKFGISGDYVLFVGTLQPRKNIARMVEAFGMLKKAYPFLQLVIVGKKGWLYDSFYRAVEEGKRSVLFLDFVSDEELAELYRNARCFVLPSLYEGFGIPVLEAMACGCPVVVSNVSSLPEVVGDAGILVNPYEPNDIARGIRDVLESPALRKKLKEKGLKRVKSFSWKTCAGKTWEVLEELAMKNG